MPLIAIYLMFDSKKKNSYLLISFLLFLPLTIYSIRCMAFLQLISIYMIALSIPYIDSKKLLITIIAYLLILLVLKNFSDYNNKQTAKETCPVSLMLQEIEPSQKTLLASFWSSLYYAWHKGYKVIGSPHHRNADGIIYTYDIFDNPETTNHTELLQSRNIDKIIICKTIHQDRESLRKKLTEGGELKGWNRVEQSEKLDKYFIYLTKQK